MNLQPLYDVKERLESAALAGVSLLGEDFRLQRAAEGLKPLAAASPVFGKIDAGLTRLLSAPPEQRAGLLLDVLALVDAVAYTQAKTGVDGELEPLPAGGGTYRQISYGQLSPLLAALTTTGGGRMEIVKAAWDNHPEFFEDYRVLTAVIADLGDTYGEMAELNASLLKKIGPSVIPLLKKDFDPAGKKEMSRRVEVIAALEGKAVTPWLREILPDARRDVRITVIHALAEDRENTELLLDLAKSERGKNRDAVLNALARQDGDEVAAFWKEELDKNAQAVTCLRFTTRSDWASDLVARGLWDRLEQALGNGPVVPHEAQAELIAWLNAVNGKSSPSMLDFWRWADARMDDIQKLTHHTGKAFDLDEQLNTSLLYSLCYAGPGPLCELCLELWGKHKNIPQYLPHALAAALLTRSAAEVYDEFSAYVPKVRPLLPTGMQKQGMHNGVLQGLNRVRQGEDGVYRVDNVWPTAQPIDQRWIKRLAHAVWKYIGNERERRANAQAYAKSIADYDMILIRLADKSNAETCREMIAYLRERMVEEGQAYNHSQQLLLFGGSPKGVLGKAMKKDGPAYLYYVWNMLNEAAKVLPAGEVADLCQEVLDAKCIRTTGNELALAEKALPATIMLLKAGKPFPEWSDWHAMR